MTSLGSNDTLFWPPASVPLKKNASLFRKMGKCQLLKFTAVITFYIDKSTLLYELHLHKVSFELHLLQTNS